MRQDVEVYEPSAIEAISKADIDMQITTAKKYPRDPVACGNAMVKMATLSEDVAEQCFYSLPRAGKKIEGPSVRMAEIALSSWKNCRVASHIIAIENDFVVAEGVGWDLESNVGVKTQSRRRITNKDGGRYNDDMIAVTSNAACAVALREAIFKLVPRALVNKAYDAARRIAVGDKSKLPQRVESAISRFAKLGVTEDRILASLNKSKREEISLGDIETLLGTYTAIMDGDITVQNAFKTQGVIVESEPADEPEAPETAPESAPTQPEQAPAAAAPAPAPKRGRPPTRSWRERYQSKALAGYKALKADGMGKIRDQIEAQFGTADDWEEEAFEAAYNAVEAALAEAKA